LLGSMLSPQLAAAVGSPQLAKLFAHHQIPLPLNTCVAGPIVESKKLPPLGRQSCYDKLQHVVISVHPWGR
jgi:hypothetical protein